MFVQIPDCISIRSDRLIYRKAFEEFNFSKKKSLAQVNNETNLRNSTPSGHINRKIRLRMARIIHNWIDSVKYINSTQPSQKSRLFTFVTLTLPATQMHTDKELHRQALGRFLVKIQRKYGVINYMWRAERQKNSNIHYHVICDSYIHWKSLRYEWNAIMNDLGYIDQYRTNQKNFHKNGFKLNVTALAKWPEINQRKAYQEGVESNWSNPNSTDIHSLKSIKDAAKYVMKYVSKSDEVDKLQKLDDRFKAGLVAELQYQDERKVIMDAIVAEKINGKVWGCSDAIKTLSDPKIIKDLDVTLLMEKMVNDPDTKEVVKDEVVILYNPNLQYFVSKFPSIVAQVNLKRQENYFLAYGRDFRPVRQSKLAPYLDEDLIHYQSKIKQKATSAIQLQLSYQLI